MANKLTAAEKMLKSKRSLVKRLRNEITWVQRKADEEIARVNSRIRIATSLIEALEKGTLKP